MDLTAINLTINGLSVGDEGSYKVSLQDLDNEGYRSITTGKLIRNRIRKDVYKIYLSFPISSLDRVSNILKAIDGETFNVSFYDVINKVQVTRQMYSGDRSFNYVIANKNGYRALVQELTFNLIEV